MSAPRHPWARPEDGGAAVNADGHRASGLVPRDKPECDGPRPRSSEAFLEAATSHARPRIDTPILIVVAHPDDETLGCGALLPRLARPTILHVTDGSPRGGLGPGRQDPAAVAAYAKRRREELAAAMSLASIAEARLVCLNVPDQRVALDLAEVVQKLTPYLDGVAIVLTHAYEGGHPDHDATAIAVWAAASRLGARAPAVVAMPFYRADQDGSDWVRQRFGLSEPAVVLRLTSGERQRKAAMLACFASQAETLRPFGAADEAFRPASRPDLSRPPNDGHVLYDRYGWGVSSAEFGRLARTALHQLGLGAPA